MSRALMQRVGTYREVFWYVLLAVIILMALS